LFVAAGFESLDNFSDRRFTGVNTWIAHASPKKNAAQSLAASGRPNKIARVYARAAVFLKLQSTTSL
jgi:hypothetical protein